MRIAIQAALMTLSGMTTALLSACGDGSVSADVAGNPRSVTTLRSFSGDPGDTVPMEIIQGSDGNFYGVTSGGGTNGEYVTALVGESLVTQFEAHTAGTAVKITPAGEVTALWNFGNDAADGLNPSSLIEGRDGDFYGTTAGGGLYGGLGQNYGSTIFRLSPSGVETVLWSFGAGVGGSVYPHHLIEGADGTFYGITSNGGVSRYVNAGYEASGTVFKFTPQGVITELWNFSADGDGAKPTVLIQGIDGNLYGTTELGGANGYGTLFRLTPDGTETVLWSFCRETDGCQPNALFQGADGNLYGTTSGGGSNKAGTVFQFNLATGVLTREWDFATVATDNGYYPNGLIEGVDGNLYGTTDAGGFAGSDTGGTLFRLSRANVLTTLWTFSDAQVRPYGLVQSRDGHVYGTTAAGGTYNKGTLFRY